MTPTPRKSGIRLPWSQHEESDASQPADTGADASEASAPTGDMTTASDSPAETAAPAQSTVAGAAAPTPPTAAAEPTTDDGDNALLASLVTAMREVAERERESSVSTLRQSVDEAVESLRTRAAEQGDQLRERSEADIAAIGDWVNAETERITAEGERRRDTRRQLLTQQLSDHEQRSGTEIESLYARIQEYERELTSFFAQLHDINDPAAFGTAAKRMPRPPSIVAAATALAAAPPAAAPEVTEAAPAPTAEAADESTATEQETEQSTEPMATSEPAADEDATADEAAEVTSGAVASEEASPAEEATEGAAEDAPAEQTDPAPAGAGKTSSIVPDTHEERLSALGIDRNGSDAETPVEDDAGSASDDADAAGSAEDATSDPLRARLAELDAKIGGDAAGEPATATVVAPGAGGEVATAIVVHGLGSFGAITSFKQALERVDGVHGISLSLGPTGEFVYRATHEADFDLVVAIEQIEHGAAQIERQADGSLRVVVQRGR